MKIKISKLPFITFLKTIKYICYTVFVTWRRIYLKKYPRNQATSREYCKTYYMYIDPIVENIRTQSLFLVCTRFSLFKNFRYLALRTNEIPMYFELQVKYWITFNEPWIVSYLNYGTGQGAPARKGAGTNSYIVGHNLLRAHAKAARLYKRQYQSKQKGWSITFFPCFSFSHFPK